MDRFKKGDLVVLSNSTLNSSLRVDDRIGRFLLSGGSFTITWVDGSFVGIDGLTESLMCERFELDKYAIINQILKEI